MPKRSKHPKLRTYVKRGRGGQVWVSYAYDMRGTGKPDIPLGNDYNEALRRWAEIHLNAPRHAGTLEEAFAAWEARGIQEKPDGTKRRPETVSGYLKCLRAIRKPFGAALWADIDLPTLRKYVQARSAKSRAIQEMQLLSVIWAWARMEGMTNLPWPAVGMQNSGWKGKKGVRQVKMSDEAFDAIYRHADQALKDALDIMTATGIRLWNVPDILLSDIRDGKLFYQATKTGKRAEFKLSTSKVLPPLIARRKAMRKPEHLFLLADARRKRRITLRALGDRFAAARKLAAAEVPECAGIWLKDMRKRAGQLTGSIVAASRLYQHSSLSVTSQHYVQGEELDAVR